ncbi:MAG: SCO family protein [Thermaceae bacterium]|nr:SCO family protein [Thermaceae bacterium]
MMRRILTVALLVGVPLALGLMIVSQRDQYQPYGTRLMAQKAAYDFSLTAPNGKTVKLSDYRGKVRLIFFGYVNCPDVCPTTMLELSKVYKALTPQEQARVQVMMISVDPERDTQEVLGKYVAFFSPAFVGLTGTPDQIAQVAQNYGVFYQKSNIKSAKEYTVDHSATVFAVDPQGNLRLIYGNGKPAQTEKVVQDVRWMLKG